MPYAQLGPIAVHLPSRVETNQMLQQQFPRWDLKLIEEKTGIRQRHIAEPGETSSDLAVAAAEKLFAEHGIDRKSIDFILLCTQTPDYPLPTTSCLIQDRLGLRTSCGAIDFNLGCSGFVYGLAIADGLIQSGAAKNILLLTAETYSKYIDDDDRSLRTIFGDGAAATLRFGQRPAIPVGIPIWQRRQWRRPAAGRRRWRATCRGRDQAEASKTMEEPSVYGRTELDQFYR